ncbi:osteoclast-stimulating factor 1 isoform X1 [Salarias fasciatus]|uniref:osteoclast-stimulating factor 1 isoform X1 n=1 Tax=Salarias fasciatus TaxID=181472 RepID=UPI0011764B2F|nr:osteoclast-stimulating factor 1 isoform X1 [Salarias fasciatus]
MSKPPPKPAKPGQVKVFRALFTFDPRTPDELYFEEGDILYISDTSDSNWWKGTCRGRSGLIPSNYVAEQAESIDNPMHEAAKRGNLSWLRECVDNKVGINGLDKAGNTALYWGCHGGHRGNWKTDFCTICTGSCCDTSAFVSPSDVVEVLLSQPNVELNQQNKLGDTALHAAAWKGYSDIVEMLLNKNARTDIRNNENKLALEMATNAQCASLLKRKLGSNITRTHSNAEEYLDDSDSD